MSGEKVSYQVLEQEGNLELRRYEPMIVVTSRVSDLAGGNGFNQLFNFINGYNHESKKIAMTAPVIDTLDGRISTTSFVMPRSFQLSDVPMPKDPALAPRVIGERQVAVIRFSGSVDTRSISDRKTELETWLKQKSLKPVGTMELARYNAPYVPALARRNELIVEVESAT